MQSKLEEFTSRLRGCVVIALKCKFVILNSSHVILSAAKNLVLQLRTGSVKNLIKSMCCKTEILRLGPQNDITTQPLIGRMMCRKNTDKINIIYLTKKKEVF